MVPEDTYIATLSGEQICNVKISDVIDMFIEQPNVDVLSHDGKKITASMISNTRSTDARDFVSLQFEDTKSLILTPDHQVYTTDKQWKRAQALHAGEFVLSFENKPKKITSTHTVRDLISRRIYALAVSPDQCYFANDVLIHNES